MLRYRRLYLAPLILLNGYTDPAQVLCEHYEMLLAAAILRKATPGFGMGAVTDLAVGSEAHIFFMFI